MPINFSKNNPFKGFKITKNSAKQSVDWFANTIDDMVKDDTSKNAQKDANQPANGNADGKTKIVKELSVPKSLQLGALYLQSYDAKHKATLPVWDQLPLFFLLRFLPDGYLGLNLHYMDVGMRVAVLGTLMEYANNKKMDDTTRIRMSWNLINSVSKLEPLKDCIKHYLFDHVTSRPIFITSENWVYTASLPLEKWVYQPNGKKK